MKHAIEIQRNGETKREAGGGGGNFSGPDPGGLSVRKSGRKKTVAPGCPLKKK